ncbi:hypothetical protein ASD50_10585 [Mesorhizobium sp. Root552]|uniref:RT0821/Lpp0805 family surface protein n=1 Tax=Mesorhizobium sp. Root552 TaxID=1736555 RepID=UPI0006FA28D0|nr:RT0821/Lpp0805 family surface protein [Mesorhizobium sp. Root552]KQZ16287.1 hypothetical protein ASD50_10585 [Mesorhizobium sp. Root552]
MSRSAQPFDSWQYPNIASFGVKIVTLACVAALAGCGVGGFSLEKAEVDRAIITSNVQASATVTDGGMVADQLTIRNAVSSADLEESAGRSLSWANADTGSRGSITGLTESRNKGELCREFAATRESFDGIALYNGRICMVGAGVWRIDDFKAA